MKTNMDNIFRFLFCSTICLTMHFGFGIKIVNAQSTEKIHQFFEGQVSKFNSEKNKYSNEITQINFVEYKRQNRELKYHYTTNILSIRGQNQITDDDLIATKAMLVSEACKSDMAPFMRQHNLRIVHVYYDSRSKKELMKIFITKRDC